MHGYVCLDRCVHAQIHVLRCCDLNWLSISQFQCLPVFSCAERQDTLVLVYTLPRYRHSFQSCPDPCPVSSVQQKHTPVCMLPWTWINDLASTVLSPTFVCILPTSRVQIFKMLRIFTTASMACFSNSFYWLQMSHWYCCPWSLVKEQWASVVTGLCSLYAKPGQ